MIEAVFALDSKTLAGAKYFWKKDQNGNVVLDKLEINEQKYPVELAKGNALKYDRRG